MAAKVDLKIASDCRFLSAHISGNPGNIDVNVYNNGEFVTGFNESVFSIESGFVFGQDFVYSIATLIGDNPGLITFDVMDGEGMITDDIIDMDITETFLTEPGRATGSVLYTCDLDCCLAQKTLTLSKCDCDKSCSESLQDAQKLFLQIQAMNTLLMQQGTDLSINAGINAKVQEMFYSAQDLCKNNCGCNC